MTVEEFTAKLDGLGQQLSDPQSILTEVGTEIVNAMKAGAPVDTGALKNSISYTINDDTLSINMIYYGSFQNYGVNGTETRPSNQVQFGVSPRPASEPFFAFKTRRFGLNPRSFFNMDTITNQVAQAFLNTAQQL